MKHYAYTLLVALALIPRGYAASASKGAESLESTQARQNFKQVLNAINDAWFGKHYAGVNAVDLHGTMAINLTAAALKAKVEQVGQGAVKGEVTKGATVNCTVKGTYFANSDFRTELSGDFGNLLSYRVGTRGFLYSKEQNAWTSKVERGPLDAPASYLGWFRQCLNDIQAVYVDGSTFKATMSPEAGVGDTQTQTRTLTFTSATGPYDTKKREQSMAESLGFWKHGTLKVVFDTTKHLPTQMNYSNEGQGIATNMTFSYGSDGKLSAVTIANQSQGMQGPASLAMTYDAKGLLNHLDGQMGFPQGEVRFDLGMTFAKGRKVSSIVSVPPPTATKKGREELETMLLVGLAGKALDLQRGGFNLRSVSLASR